MVDLIDASVPLKKTGRNHSACCPFHDEKTPSFTVSQDKQFYHCFGCGAHGTAISFLMEYERLDFLDAVRDLAAHVGMEIPQGSYSASSAQSNSKPLYELMQQVSSFYRQQLKEHPRGSEAINYLKARSVSGETAAEFGVGYAPPGWDTLQKHFGNDNTQPLATTGMLIKKESGGHYDRFRERIMFPIRDSRGRIIGFGGRVLGDDTPKYLNSPETPLFHKGQALYGLFEARQANRNIQRLLIVEGYMDVVMLAQHNIRYAVATLGTATTIEHLELMFRTTSEVIFCFDGDRAGREAANRALENTLPAMQAGRQARFLFLPDGEDPDSLVQKEGKVALEARIDAAAPLSTYLYEHLARQVDMSSIDGQARLVELARPHLNKLPAGVFKHMMVTRLAEITRMEERSLSRLLGNNKPITASAPPSHNQRPLGNKQDKQPSLVRQAITLLLNTPSLGQLETEPQRFASLNAPGITLLIELLEMLRTSPHLTTGAVLERWREREEGRYLAKLVQQENLVDSDQEEIFSSLLQQLYRRHVIQRKDILCNTQELTQPEKEELQQLYKYLNENPATRGGVK
ncbi:MAG: DNA primase [Gammaproteobacteria bacterium]|nr:DNA primase [Gammaproteobacteria bacterium]